MNRRLMKTKAVLFLLLMAGMLVSPTSSAQGRSAASPDSDFESFLLPEIRADHPAIANVDVLLDVGHGGIDSGTVYGDVLEKDINLAIAQKTYETLRKRGYCVLLNRSGDYALSSENLWLRSRSRHVKDLAQRSHLANEVKPKMLLSLHINSARRSGKRGPLIIHQKNEQSKQLAIALQTALNPLYGTTEEPVMMGKKYYILRHTKVPAVIVEMGFLTNAQDRAMLQKQDMQWSIAAKIADGVKQYMSQQQQQQ
ncbi:N-acetylmuramoyl-L-alanine amidase family protein [Paenibacillus cremeus]|uniref:N-acetylmuramoyl-L-alanine amidase family protein n=1 Tax=Paenibacillus cremeus TaxID=2163881 RepID=UPI0037045717